MLPAFRTATTATLAALSLAAATAAPVQAGQRERDFLTGVAATVIVGSVIHSLNTNRAYAQPHYAPPPPAPVQYVPVAAQPRLSATAAAHAFRSYSPAERRAIQRELYRAGYYHGTIDGSFGPGTFRAVSAYAADYGFGPGIDSTSAAYTVYDSLIY